MINKRFLFYIKALISRFQEEWLTQQITLDDQTKSAFKIVTYIIAVFGLLGNLALFYTYWKKNRKVRFNVLMLMITTFDLAYLVVELVAYSTEDTFDRFYGITAFIYDFTFACSVYTTALTVIERFLILCLEK